MADRRDSEGPHVAAQPRPLLPFYLVSIPWTGTRFVQRLLRDNGLRAREEIHTHVHADWHRWFGDRVLVPMRDPILHAITAVNLGRDHGQGLFRLGDFDVIAGLANERTCIFPVDIGDWEDRDCRMIALAAWLGIDAIAIDWTPEGQTQDRSGLKAKYLETGEVPNPAWLEEIGDGARAMLKGLGYRMRWLDA